MICRFCGVPIRRYDSKGPWLDPEVTDYIAATSCDAAPEPTPGIYGDHQPITTKRRPT